MGQTVSWNGVERRHHQKLRHPRRRANDGGFFITLCRRIHQADIIDWMFGLLFAAVGALIASALLAFFHSDDKPFKAVTFEAPAVIETPRGIKPQVDGLPAPSIDYTGHVPVKLTRIIDCSMYDCPSGGIPVTVDVVWEEVNIDNNTIRSFLIADDIPAVYEEGTDYIRGQLLMATNDLQPFEFPSVVLNYLDRENKSVSAWRISGVNTILGGLEEAAWSTEVVHVLYDPAVEAE
jgi:hypothetical protein